MRNLQRFPRLFTSHAKSSTISSVCRCCCNFFVKIVYDSMFFFSECLFSPRRSTTSFSIGKWQFSLEVKQIHFTFDLTSKHLALILGACPVDMTPLALHLCAGPKKNPPSARRRDDELHATSFHDRCNCRSTTVASTTAPVELARPAHQGDWESPWPTRPRGSASAPRQECPARPAQLGHRSPC